MFEIDYNVNFWLKWFFFYYCKLVWVLSGFFSEIFMHGVFSNANVFLYSAKLILTILILTGIYIVVILNFFMMLNLLEQLRLGI